MTLKIMPAFSAHGLVSHIMAEAIILAKEAFFRELFFEKEISTVFMRIRKENLRSRRAAEKLPIYC